MSDILVEPGRVATIRINRPDQRNALNLGALEQLAVAVDQLGHDAAVAVIRLTAVGTRAFSAGADLGEVRDRTDVSGVRSYFAGMARVLRGLYECPKPVVAVAFGYTLAGGMGLAAGADLLVAADDTVFGLPEMEIGLFPMVVMAPIARLLGRRRALELAWTARRVDVQTAERWGFVNHVVPAPHREEAGFAYCQALASRSSLVAQLGKAGVGPSWDGDYRSALALLEEQVAAVALTPDAREGLQAFFDKRPAAWPR